MQTEHKHITQPEDWWKAFNEQAKKDGLNLSSWIGNACVDQLTVRAKRKLSKRVPNHRPKGSLNKPKEESDGD